MHNFSGVISSTLKEEIEKDMMKPWIQKRPANPFQTLWTKEPLMKKKIIEKKKELGKEIEKERKLLHVTITGTDCITGLLEFGGKHYYFLNWIGLFITVLKSIEHKEDSKQILD